MSDIYWSRKYILINLNSWLNRKGTVLTFNLPYLNLKDSYHNVFLVINSIHLHLANLLKIKHFKLLTCTFFCLSCKQYPNYNLCYLFIICILLPYKLFKSQSWILKFYLKFKSSKPFRNWLEDQLCLIHSVQCMSCLTKQMQS